MIALHDCHWEVHIHKYRMANKYYWISLTKDNTGASEIDENGSELLMHMVLQQKGLSDTYTGCEEHWSEFAEINNFKNYVLME